MRAQGDKEPNDNLCVDVVYFLSPAHEQRSTACAVLQSGPCRGVRGTSAWSQHATTPVVSVVDRTSSSPSARQFHCCLLILLTQPKSFLSKTEVGNRLLRPSNKSGGTRSLHIDATLTTMKRNMMQP